MGFIWPILASLLGMLLVLFIIFLLWIVSLIIPLPIIREIINFIYSNIGLIFVMSVAFGYASHLSKYRPPINAVAPLISAIGAVFLVFFILSVLRILLPANTDLSAVIDIVQDKLLVIFAVILAAGYLAYFLHLAREQ